MIRQVREKDQNKICSNRERDPRLAHELTILQLTERIYCSRTEDANKKGASPKPLTLHSFLTKTAAKLNLSRL